MYYEDNKNRKLNGTTYNIPIHKYNNTLWIRIVVLQYSELFETKQPSKIFKKISHLSY